MATLIPFTRLSPSTQQHVLTTFVYWHLDTTIKTQQEWAEKKAFYIKADGSLDQRYRHCLPAWMSRHQER